MKIYMNFIIYEILKNVSGYIWLKVTETIHSKTEGNIKLLKEY